MQKDQSRSYADDRQHGDEAGEQTTSCHRPENTVLNGSRCCRQEGRRIGVAVLNGGDDNARLGTPVGTVPVTTTEGAFLTLFARGS
jgi:hypothetical protein